MPKVVKKTQPKKKATKPTSKDKKKVLTKKNQKTATKAKNEKQKKKVVAKKESKTDDLVLTVPNRHSAKPPNYVASDDAYVSYFMNRYGEQAVFIAEKAAHGNKINARCWMGDCGWQKAMPVDQEGRVGVGSDGTTLNGHEMFMFRAFYVMASEYFGTPYDDTIQLTKRNSNQILSKSFQKHQKFKMLCFLIAFTCFVARFNTMCGMLEQRQMQEMMLRVQAHRGVEAVVQEEWSKGSKKKK
jgi:hypothetical protein